MIEDSYETFSIKCKITFVITPDEWVSLYFEISTENQNHL